ncbi:MAG: thioredoxin [Epsilonproteobacteria bacterium]|nr:MAG: thioredoxin [Campylobacterota bacterium]
MITEITEENYTSNISEGVVLLDFWASWCGPCRMLSPILDKIGEKYEGRVTVCKINTDEQQNLALQENIRSIPTLKFYKDGEVQEVLMGMKSEVELCKVLDKLLGD